MEGDDGWREFWELMNWDETIPERGCGNLDGVAAPA